MADEDIIKRRLIIDGDGTGDDRRLNVLLKQFLKWVYSKNESPENNQVIYDRLMAQLAQCTFAALKTENTSLMIEKELDNYRSNSQHIEMSIDVAKCEIEKSKKQLVLAKEIRKNKMEYDQLAKIIKEQPDRKETQQQIELLQTELSELTEKKLKLERKFEKRQKDFTVLMYAIRELESQLAEENSSDNEDKIKSDDNELAVGGDTMIKKPMSNLLEGVSDDEIDNNESPTVKFGRHKTFLEREEKQEYLDASEETPMLVDEDAILELSIEKDENDAKIEDIKDTAI